MERSDMDRFRELLIAKRSELLDRVRAMRPSEAEAGEGEAPDLGDRALNTVSRDLLYQLSTGERDLVRRIDWAISRLDEGSYGSCVHCGREVQRGRLQAVPWARHCIECQELQDRGDI
jgi:DnaK suppressor protein